MELYLDRKTDEELTTLLETSLIALAEAEFRVHKIGNEQDRRARDVVRDEG